MTSFKGGVFLHFVSFLMISFLSHLVLPLEPRCPAVPPLPGPGGQRLRPFAHLLAQRQNATQQAALRHAGPRGRGEGVRHGARIVRRAVSAGA